MIVVEATPEGIRDLFEKRWSAIIRLMTSYGYAMCRFNDAGRIERTDQLSHPDPYVVFSAELSPKRSPNRIDLEAA
jgi:hypothetical protein